MMLTLPYIIKVQIDTLTSIPEVGELIEPKPILFSFETIGWKIVFTVLAVTFIILFYIWLRNFIKTKYKRTAINNINTLNQSDNQVKEIFTNLKIVAITTYGRENTANLSGDIWLKFLNKTGKNTNFNNHKEDIQKALYKDQYIDNKIIAELKTLAIKWIKTHNDDNS